MGLKSLFQWPPKCKVCGAQISRWTDAGVSHGNWLHKRCWLEVAGPPARDTEPLTSPLDALRGGLPMIVFLLLFHFGGGAAVMGWFMISRFDNESSGLTFLVAGLTSFFIGLGGFALEILLRTRAESVRQQLEGAGGWQPLELD